MPFRADSPAHHMENVCIALDLMCKPLISDSNTICHLDLLSLLKSGVALNLAEGKQLTIGMLRPESPWVGRPLNSRDREELGGEIEIIAILRAE